MLPSAHVARMNADAMGVRKRYVPLLVLYRALFLTSSAEANEGSLATAVQGNILC